MLEELGRNQTLICCLVAWFSAQLIKYLIDGIRRKEWSVAHLFLGSGGMPSSHTAFVSALVMRVGMTEGFHSTAFAISFVVLFIVMTDAIGVRRETGRQGSAINLLMDWFTMEHDPMVESKDLKERVGHSPLEVLIGFFWGVACALVFGK